MLDEFTLVTARHRQAAIRLLPRIARAKADKRPGRKRQYGAGVTAGLRVVWAASDRRCSRRLGGRRGLTTTRPGSRLSIPSRPFADGQENQPGFRETDLVAHGGESTEGFYRNTLCTVDVASGWAECLPLWGEKPGAGRWCNPQDAPARTIASFRAGFRQRQ